MAGTTTSRSCTIGVDLGGTNLRVAAYTPEDGVLEMVVLPTRLSAGWRAVVGDMCGAIRQLLEHHLPGRELGGIGIGTPGPLELPEGVLWNPPNLPGWNGIRIKDAIEADLGMSVLFESDANLAALAEYLEGTGKTLEQSSLCMLTLGTGVGNGIILNGEIWHGFTGMGGEAGHVTIYPEGDPCGCGGRGCLERYASATAVSRLAWEAGMTADSGAAAIVEGGGPILTSQHVAERARVGDPPAVRVFEQVGTALGIGLAGLVNTLNLPLYVVGGGVSRAWDLFAPRMFEELRLRSYVYRLTEAGENSGRKTVGQTMVLPAELGSDAGILGACRLPLLHQIRCDIE
jgi:glucokinase